MTCLGTIVRGRLSSLVKSQEFSTFEEYYKKMVDDTTGGGLLSLTERISTNHLSPEEVIDAILVKRDEKQNDEKPKQALN